MRRMAPQKLAGNFRLVESDDKNILYNGLDVEEIAGLVFIGVHLLVSR